MIPDSAAALAGQVLVVGFGAGPLPQALRHAAEQGQLGGFILFRRNLELAEAGSVQARIEPIVALLAELRRIFPRDLPPLLGVDQEGGRVARLGPPVLRLPAMRALGRHGDAALTRDAAALLGAQLRALGFTMDLAPVLDVDSNPDNPAIGDRSFGREVDEVIRHGGAFAEGLERAGLPACGKHFPGHGDTDVDSHLVRPWVRHDRAHLERIELAPFVALMPRLPALLSSHVVYEALDPGVPATLSHAISSRLLRDELGYAGVLFSDDLEMQAIAGHMSMADGACAAVEAGCDIVLICSDVQASMAAHEALTRRAERETAFRDRLREAAARNLLLRRRYIGPPPSREERVRAFAPQAQQALEERLARAATG